MVQNYQKRSQLIQKSTVNIGFEEEEKSFN